MGLKLDFKKAGKRERYWGPWDRQRSDQRWLVPETVEVVEGQAGPSLDWTWPEIPDKPPFNWPEITTKEDGELLDWFLDLANGEVGPERVASFVERFSVPRLCERHRLTLRSTHPKPRCRQGGTCAVWKPLPVEEVVRLARDARGVLAVTAGLDKEGRATREEWGDFLQAHFPREEEGQVSEWAVDHAEADTEEQYRRLTLYLDDWTRDGGIRLRVQRRDGVFQVEPWHRNTLIGAVSRQLFLTVVGDAGLAVCHGCGRLHTKNRKPKKGQRSWCDDCGKGSNYRAAKRVSARA